jgi:hypothetical protein
VLSFHVLIAALAGATATVALQWPNHFALPLFFLLLLALASGMLVASFHAFSDIELLRHRILGLRRQVSDLVSRNGSGSVGADNPGTATPHPAAETMGNPSPQSDRAIRVGAKFESNPISGAHGPARKSHKGDEAPSQRV